MPGQIIGDRYRIVKQLGKKLGRWTLLAEDIQTETLVISKLLFIDTDTSPDELKLFKREIETLQSLSHPATPRYLEYFEMELPKDGQALALIQSYIDGKSLHTFLQQGKRFSVAQAKQIASAVLQILAYLHDLNPPIVHRDIKPSNILLTRSPDFPPVCLVDFGSVKSFSASSTDHTTFTLIGTDGYMPPEQMGRRAVRASDLYSLGVTIVTAITGKEPNELPRRGMQLNIEQAFQQQTVQADTAFIAWLKQMTAPELDQRFKTASESLAALPLP